MRSLLLAAIFLLTSCTTVPPVAPPSQVSFSGPPFALNVRQITVVDDYVTPHRPPNVEYLTDFPPALAVRQWTTARLVAAGHNGRLEVDIRDAGIVRHYLPKQQTGISGMLTKEQTERYDGRLTVTLKIYDDTHLLPVAHIDASVEQSSTLREDASLADREQLYRDISTRLINALDTQMSGGIRQYFTPYLL